jgi:hypothetical protein
MASAFTLISSVTAGSGGVSNMNFTNIPQTYTDLLLLGSVRAAADNTNIRLTFNSNSSTVYLDQQLANGNNSAVAGKNSAAAFLSLSGANAGVSYTANIFSSFRVYIPNYTLVDNKYYFIDTVTENNSNTYIASALSSATSNINAAITSIQMVPPSSTFDQHSIISLYGISKS